MPFSQIKTSLRVRLLLISVSLEIVMLSILVGNSLHSVGEQQQEYLHHLQARYQQLFSVGLSVAVFNHDLATINDALQQIYTGALTDSDLPYIRVFDSTGEELATIGYPRIVEQKNRIFSEFHTFDFYRDLILSRAELEIGVVPIGYVEYGLSIHPLNEARHEILQQHLLIAACAILSTIVLLGLLGRYLTRHFNSLQRATEAITRGAMPSQLPLQYHDEIGDLARAMQTMAERLNEQQQQLQRSSDELSVIANYSYSCELWFSEDLTLRWVNQASRRVLGYTPEELLKSDNFLLELTDAEYHDCLSSALQKALKRSQSRCEPFRIRHADGEYFWAALLCKSAYSESGNLVGIRASILDIEEQRNTEQQLSESMRLLANANKIQQNLLENAQGEQARLRSLLTSMSVGILFENTEHTVDYYNPAFVRIWSLNAEKMHIGIPTERIMQYSNSVLNMPEHASQRILSLLPGDDPAETLEIVTSDGRTINQMSYPVQDEEARYIGQIWMFEDITRQKQTAEQLLYMAERDHLTGLYNRRRFQDELDRMITIHGRTEQSFAMLFFDLDEFKYINDTFGHSAGDTVLVRISNEIQSQVRANEFFSRLGGDEFALLAPVDDTAQAQSLAERIVRTISGLPFRFDNKNIRMTTSVGVSIYPDHGNHAEAIVSRADSAMYAAKQRGKNTARVFDPSMTNIMATSSHLTWNERIINALDNDQFVLHFQAIKDIKTNAINHYELLIRMLDSEDHDKLIMPNQFIPVAEKTSKILLIDQWVIRKAIKLLEQNPRIPGLALNLSGRSLDEPTLPIFIAKLLEESGVKASRLILELTETVAVSDISDAQRFIEEVHQLGCQVYLDDFGAGYSTFAYLKHIHADCLKFDGQFILNLSNDPTNQLFVRSMVDIAHGLNKKTVAEFVEDAETVELLRQLGVDMVQGYYIDKPSEMPS